MSRAKTIFSIGLPDKSSLLRCKCVVQLVSNIFPKTFLYSQLRKPKSKFGDSVKMVDTNLLDSLITKVHMFS